MTVVQATGSVPGLIRGLQERTARALPAAVVDHLGGWWLRHADSAAWWASAVLPHGDDGPSGLPQKISYAERFYAGHGAPPRFQVSPAASSPTLDDALARRGYRLESPMSLRSAPVTRVISRLPAHDARISIDDQPVTAWFEAWHAVHGAGGDPGPEWEMLGRVERPSAYVSVLTGAGVIAVGRAVADTGWAGVFGMATRPEARGRGAARAVLAALARWAGDHGTGQLYLQVERGNAAAGRLYEHAGFTELCRYHYRTG